jgi:hypothetical protein
MNRMRFAALARLMFVLAFVRGAARLMLLINRGVPARQLPSGKTMRETSAAILIVFAAKMGYAVPVAAKSKIDVSLRKSPIGILEIPVGDSDF